MEKQIDYFEMHKHLTPDEDLNVMHIMGGMMEFEKTGEYPNKLRIISLKYNHVWRLKVKQENQEGVLRIKRVAVYNYKMTEKYFYVQQVVKGASVTDWVLVNATLMLRD